MKQTGFTLLELMIVTAVMATLYVIIIPACSEINRGEETIYLE